MSEIYWEVLRAFLHYGGHFLVPAAFVFAVRPSRRKSALFILWATMLIDLDHLLATPIFDPGRCSIGFHPLHTSWAAFGFAILIFVPNWRVKLVGVGCLWHLVVDYCDCLLM